MIETKAPTKTPSPAKNTDKTPKMGGSERSQAAIFVSMALDMSWRLAVVVLVPIIGGFELDKATGNSPVFLILGFVLAMAGMALVMWRTLQVANKIPVPKAAKPKETHS
jgi:F0F1-type ATP synthase assembly protein I